MFGFRRKVYLNPDAEKMIVSAIGDVEKHTRAEIRVHLGRKIRKDILSDAMVVFKKLGMHRTELRSGILIYVVPSLHEFAIVGDIGIHEKVKEAFWNSVRDTMQSSFSGGQIESGIIKGIELAGEKLKEYFPPTGGINPNEISNEISRG